MNLAIIGDTELEVFFDKIDTKEDYKLAQLNGKGCAFLCANNKFEDNLNVMKKLGIGKVLEISGDKIEENREKMISELGIEYSGILIKGKKTCIKPLLSGIISDIDDSKVKLLSERELEVLALLSKGMTNKDIAQKLFLSEKTVKNHLNNIFKKIDVTDRTKAAVFAINNNIN